MSELHVDLDMLAQHATRLGAVGDQIRLASDASGQVDLHDGAFGLLCAFLPLIVNGAEVSTGDAITAGGETSSAAASEVRAMAEAYARVDEGVAARFERLAGGTGGTGGGGGTGTGDRVVAV